MYSSGTTLGAGAAGGAAVAALPLTSGNGIFQTLLIATAMLAATIILVRVAKVISQKEKLQIK
ncbi:MAG: hypothetical protein ACM3KH_00200 [Thiobacillus sp.]